MKKLLAMVLALVMTMSLVVTANAAKLSDMSDAEAVDGDYEVAVGLLTASGVIAGYPDGSFRPQGNVTRAEMAKMICYALLGKDQAEKLPVDRQIFTDVTVDNWAAKYIQYCYSQGIIGGHGDGTFAPNDNVTGYQAAKMILVAKGYTKDGAYEGTGWEVAVATDAMKDIFKASKTLSYGNAATREEAAYYIFNGFTSPSVTYISGLDVYVPMEFQGLRQYVLGEVSEASLVRDNYGRPGYGYSLTLTATGKTVSYVDKMEAKLVYLNAKTECEIAQAVGISSFAYVDATYVDGYPEDDIYGIDRFNTVDSIGCQGTVTEIYKIGSTYDVVQIHTFLAKVADKYDAIKDQNGCVIWAAEDKITVYGGDNNSPRYGFDWTSYVDATSYAKGTYLLVQGYWIKASDYEEFAVDSMTPVSSVLGKVTDYVYDKFGSVYALIIDGKTVPVACPFVDLTDTGVEWGKSYYFFYDKNGNVIGKTDTKDAAPIWAINTDIVYMHSNGLTVKSHVLANMIGFDGAKLDAVKISKIDGETPIMIDDAGQAGDPYYAEVSDNVEENGAYQLSTKNEYNYFYTYTVGAAGYELTTVEVENAVVEIKAGNPVIVVGEKFVVMDNSTEILIKNGSTYTAVKGFAALKAMKNAVLYYEAEYADTVNTGKYLDRMVLDITNATYDGSSVYAIIFDGAMKTETTKSFTIQAWVNADAPTTYTVLKNDNTAALYNALDFDAFEYDQWKLYFNADGQVVKAELQTKNYAEVIAKGADVMTIKVGEQSQQMSTLNAKFYAIDEINELVKAGKLSEVPLNDDTTYVVVSSNKASYVYYSVNQA